MSSARSPRSEGAGAAPSIAPSSVRLDRPLVPPELLQYTLIHTGSLTERYTDQTSLLRFFSRSGHLHGQGDQRIFIGNCPAAKGPGVTGEGRSFLIGIDALWAEDELERRQKPAASEHADGQTPDVALQDKVIDAVSPHSPFDDGSWGYTRSASDDVALLSESDSTTTDGSSSSSESSSASDESRWQHRKHHSKGKGKEQSSEHVSRHAKHNPEASSAPKPHRPRRRSSKASAKVSKASSAPPDELFQKLRESSHRKHLSSGDDALENGSAGPLSLSIPHVTEPVTSHQVLHSPAPMATPSELFYTPNGFAYSENGDPLDSVPPILSDHLKVPSPGKTLIRNISEPASVVEPEHKPVLRPQKSSKSVRWDMSQREGPVPGTKDAAAILRSAAAPPPTTKPARPAEVLARPDPVTKSSSRPVNLRNDTTESQQLLMDLSAAKNASLPPGVEKLERMLVRSVWSHREDFPEEFDEQDARRHRLRWKPWEEMAVVWRRHTVDFYGRYHDPARRFFSNKFQLKHTIPLKPLQTQLSVYSMSDQIFSLRSPSASTGWFRSGKQGLRNRRHIHRDGTNILLIRARAPTIAEDWYLGLHLVLGKPKIERIEVHLPALEITIVSPTVVDAANIDEEDEAAQTPTRAMMVAQTLASGGFEGKQLVPKEDIMQAFSEALDKRRDWAELRASLERRGIHLALAWRKGHIIEWLRLDRSVDGTKRVWDLYVGAVMKQNSHKMHRLELVTEAHAPTYVSLSMQSHMIEPPALEGFIYRLRQRNENQRERMYLSTHTGFILFMRAKRARAPHFPDINRWEGRDIPKAAVLHFRKTNQERLSAQILRCRGALNPRDIISVELKRTCEGCLKQEKGELVHDHQIVHISMVDGRCSRFEVKPASAATEWAGRLSALVTYWHKRREQDASDQLSMNANTKVRPVGYQGDLSRYPSFQARGIEEQQAEASAYTPLLAESFSFCHILGCKGGILRSGRLFYKYGHRMDPFVDCFYVLTHTHLIQFEAVRRNFQKRPVPLSYHRRIKNIQLKDMYILTGESCQQFLNTHETKKFQPASDQLQLSRIYKDSLISIDEPAECTFVVWKQKPKGEGSGLGRHGSVHVFQARSRFERDHWVQSLNAVCEELARSQREREIKLTTFKHLT